MNKAKFFSLFIVFLYGCSGYEFVYKQGNEEMFLQNKISYSVSGPDSSIFLSELENEFGINKVENGYLLSVQIEKETIPIAIDNDGTASRKETEFQAVYKLINIAKNCEVMNKSINSKSSFSSGSSGYNFSTDLSQDESEKNNIRLNINRLSNYLVSLESGLRCVNEG